MKFLSIFAAALLPAVAISTETSGFTYERLDKEKAVLLVVDIQEGLYQMVRDYEPTLYREQAIAHASMADLFDLPVIMTTSADTGPNGPILKEIKQMHPNATLIQRQGEVNAWDSEEFRNAVKATKKTQVIVAGIVTDVCTTFLALSLREAGYSVWANIEASGTSSAYVRDVSNDRMAKAGVHTVSMFAILGELMRDWRATPGAKEIFPWADKHMPVVGHLARAHGLFRAGGDGPAALVFEDESTPSLRGFRAGVVSWIGDPEVREGPEVLHTNTLPEEILGFDFVHEEWLDEWHSLERRGTGEDGIPKRNKAIWASSSVHSTLTASQLGIHQSSYHSVASLYLTSNPGPGNMASAPTSPSTYKGPVGPLHHRCPQCSATGPQLLRCSACRAVRYCSREHQVAHRPEHKTACTKIRKARAKLEQEDHGVRHATADFMTPANAFESDVGHFWGIMSTRDYMRARFSLADHLLLQGTLDGVDEALSHMQDMLRLCRSDNMGVRDSVPAIMLRLDLDQECYDFVKWWATCDPDGHYDWGDTTLPHLNIHGADVLEDPDFLGKYPSLDHVVAILLLKLKLLVDIRNLKITRKILAFRRLPLDLWESIELSVVRSPLSTMFQKQSTQTLFKTEAKLLNQTRQLGATVVKANGSFIFHLFDPDEPLCTKPDAYSRGSWEEMALAMQHSYAAWWEMEGALNLLNDARACAARDSEDEIEDMMEGETQRAQDHGHERRTAEEMLEDVSVNRIWGYIDWAVENASYLGPWSERPSEQHTRENKEVWARAVAEEEGEEGIWSSDED
ncbi:hypothetical protein FDECE_5938 [Fusarium decemcellulare]|nr:hypothetical protein FDECE_5938 [Fusarium decemcellulare]